VRCALDEFELHAHLFDFEREQLIQTRVVQPLNDFINELAGFICAGAKEQHFVAQDVVHAPESLAHADRPGHWRAADFQNRFDFVEEFQAVAHFPVVLVHEGDDRRIAQTANVQQFDRLFFHAFGRVDHHQG